MLINPGATTTHAKNGHHGSIKYYGLGDLLRGTIYLHQQMQLGQMQQIPLNSIAIKPTVIVFHE